MPRFFFPKDILRLVNYLNNNSQICRRGVGFTPLTGFVQGILQKTAAEFFLGRQCGKPWFSPSYSVYYIYIYYTLYYIYILHIIYIYIYYTLYILHILYIILHLILYIWYDILLLESTISIMFNGELPILPWILSRSRRDRLRMLSDHEPCRPVGLGWAWQFGY